jgi:hypothetical protein
MDFSSSTQAAHEQTACQINFAELLKGNVDFSGVVIGDQLHVQQSIVLGFVSLRPARGHRARVGRVLIEKSALHGNLDCRGTEVAGELAVLDSPVDGVLYLGESLPEDGTKRLLTQVGENKGADLRLMPSVKDVNEIPAEGRDLVIVADVHDVLHFRIFTPGGDRAVDLGQTQLPGKKAHQIAQLRKQLGRLWDVATLSASDKAQVITAVRAIVGHTQNIRIQRCQITFLEVDGRIVPKVDDEALQRSLALTLSKITQVKFLEQLPAQIDAEGMEFRQLEAPGDDYLGVLDRPRPFHKSTYVQFEKWLRDRREEANASEAFRRRNKRDLAEGNMSLPGKIWNQLLLRPIGFGTRTHRLLYYFFAALLVSTILFWSNLSVERDVKLGPAELAKVRDGAKIDKSVPRDDWQPPKPLLMAVHVTLPMLPLASSLDVVPSDQPIFRLPDEQSAPGWARSLLGMGTYEGYAAIVSLLSWIALPLAIAGLSGFIKWKE